MLGRIEKKIESLRNVLSPVTRSIPSGLKELKDSSSGTSLENRVSGIEDSLTSILDSISL